MHILAVGRPALAIAFALMAGCGDGGALGPDGGDTSQGTAGADARPDMGGAGMGGGGTGGAGSGGSAGSGAPDACEQTNERAAIKVHQPNGDELSCARGGVDAGFSGPIPTWVGKVTASDAASLTIETCAGDGGCSPGSLRVEAVAPGLDLSRFAHVWVRVRAQMVHFRTCQQSLEITTAVPEDGSAPESPAGILLLAVVDGDTAYADSPYKVDRAKLACPLFADAGRGCGSPEPGVYAFDFSAASGSGSPLRVSMGETRAWTLGGASYTVRNLRSFQTTDCDDYWNWAYTIYADPK